MPFGKHVAWTLHTTWAPAIRFLRLLSFQLVPILFCGLFGKPTGKPKCICGESANKSAHTRLLSFQLVPILFCGFFGKPKGKPKCIFGESTNKSAHTRLLSFQLVPILFCGFVGKPKGKPKCIFGESTNKSAHTHCALGILKTHSAPKGKPTSFGAWNLKNSDG